MLTGTEVNQLAILQAWPRIWIRDNWEQIQTAVRAGLQLGAFEIQVRRSNSNEWENYSLVSNKYVSQGLYQNLLTTKINWKPLQKPQLQFTLIFFMFSRSFLKFFLCYLSLLLMFWVVIFLLSLTAVWWQFRVLEF